MFYLSYDPTPHPHLLPASHPHLDSSSTKLWRGLTSRSSFRSLKPQTLQPILKPLTQVKYNSEELDTLAMLFTTVKILYVGGALSTATALAEIIHPAATASQQELHKTLIRNEAAYFGCVWQLLHQPYTPSPALQCDSSSVKTAVAQMHQAVQASEEPGSVALSPSAGLESVPVSPCASSTECSGSRAAACRGGGALPPPLFLCGDSHCLSGARYPYPNLPLQSPCAVSHS